MQISLNGLQTKHSLPNEFPYDAINPMSAQTETFNSIDDVYKVLIECYDKCIDKGFDRLGEALYNQSLYIVNDNLLFSKKELGRFPDENEVEDLIEGIESVT